MAAPLIQKKTVLTYVGDDGETALYMASTEGPNLPARLLIETSVRADMGDPETITVTIRPGDELSDVDSAFHTPPAE